MNVQETIVNNVLRRVASLRQTMSDDEREILDALIIQVQADEMTMHSLSQDSAEKNWVQRLAEAQVVFDSESETYLATLPPKIE